MRDPEKLANARETYYYRNRTRLLRDAADRYKANRQARIDYQHHYRLVQKSLVGESYPPIPCGDEPAVP